MADAPKDAPETPSDELNREGNPPAGKMPRPHPTREETQQEIDAEDRFEATDN